jgi:hypothetical protein
MLRKPNIVLGTVAVLGCFVVGAVIGWSTIASSAGGQVSMAKVEFDQAFADATATQPRENNLAVATKVDFDQAFVDVTVIPRLEFMLAIMTKADFDQAFSKSIAAPGRENTPLTITEVDFDQAFANAIAVPRRENTPPNREKLRNAGWKRILGPI